MKKHFFNCLVLVLLAFIGCRPINPPTSGQDAQQIMHILYNGMGKPMHLTRAQLSEMGFVMQLGELSKADIEVLGLDSCYYTNTDEIHITLTSRNDSIVRADYLVKFRSNTRDAVKEFFVLDDVFASYKWEKFAFSWDGIDSFNDILLREEAKLKMDSVAASYKDYIFTNISSYQNNYENQYFYCGCMYSGFSTGGMNPNTGDGLSSLYDGTLKVNMEYSTYPLIIDRD